MPDVRFCFESLLLVRTDESQHLQRLVLNAMNIFRSLTRETSVNHTKVADIAHHSSLFSSISNLPNCCTGESLSLESVTRESVPEEVV